VSEKLFIFLAGIALTAGFAYLWIGIREKKFQTNFFFGLFATSSGIYYLLSNAGVFDAKLKIFFATAMFLFFPWFFAYEAKYVNKKVLWSITLLAIVFYIFFLLKVYFGIPPIHYTISYLAYVLIGGYCIFSCIHLVSSKSSIVWPFILVAVYFCLFAIEEIVHDTFGNVLPWRGIISFTYLDLFPTIIISMKFILLVYDQFAKRRLEAAIILYQENIDSILHQAKRFVVVMDMEGKVRFANPFFMKFYNPNNKIIDTDFIDKFIPEQDKPSFHENVIKNEQSAGDIITPVNTDKERKFVAWSFVKLKDVHSSDLYSTIYLFGADITQQIVAENDLRNAYKDLEALKNKLLSENIQLKKDISFSSGNRKIIGESTLFKYVLIRIEDAAPSDIPVLLEGETGVGKEVFANEIHEKSCRKDKPFIKVNCAAIPEQLLESELFGFEKGAFTGAERLKRGMFELADEGTLFLDEIGDLPISLQPKLLRVLQEGEIQRLGSEKVIKINVRLIVATNRSLEKEVEQGKFRSDLFYRINIFPITIPPLRQRKTDIPLLVKAFTHSFNEKYNKNIKQVPGSLMEELMNYSWPGNVRQLRNIIERAVISSSESILRLADPLPLPTNSKTNDEMNQTPVTLATLEECERRHILNVLEHSKWQVSGAQGAAALLGLPASTLRSKMKKLGIHRNDVERD